MLGKAAYSNACSSSSRNTKPKPSWWSDQVCAFTLRERSWNRTARRRDPTGQSNERGAAALQKFLEETVQISVWWECPWGHRDTVQQRHLNTLRWVCLTCRLPLQRLNYSLWHSAPLQSRAEGAGQSAEKQTEPSTYFCISHASRGQKESTSNDVN